MKRYIILALLGITSSLLGASMESHDAAQPDINEPVAHLSLQELCKMVTLTAKTKREWNILKPVLKNYMKNLDDAAQLCRQNALSRLKCIDDTQLQDVTINNEANNESLRQALSDILDTSVPLLTDLPKALSKGLLYFLRPNGYFGEWTAKANDADFMRNSLSKSPIWKFRKVRALAHVHANSCEIIYGNQSNNA